MKCNQIRTFDMIRHAAGRLLTKTRRGVAALLATAMVLPMTPAFAAFDDTMLLPVQGGDYPDIQIEGNFVRDEFGFLTGYFELGLRVQTPLGKSFQSVNVSLEYDTGILTPVDWETEGGEITLTNVGFYAKQLPTQKLESISTSAAHGGLPVPSAGGGGTRSATYQALPAAASLEEETAAYEDEGGVDEATGLIREGAAIPKPQSMSAEAVAADGSGTGGATGGGTTAPTTSATLSEAVDKGEKGLLTFTARSYKDVQFPAMTTIAAIRFKVDEEYLEHITIKKRGDGNFDLYYNPEVGNKYTARTVTDVASLVTAMTTTDPSDGSIIPGVKIMDFAGDGDIFCSKNRNVGMALRYQAWDTEYYHVPAYDPADPATFTQVTETYGDLPYTLDKPNTYNDLVVAVDPTITEPAGATAGTPGKYSYLSNLIVNQPETAPGAGDGHDYITFPLVSKRSFMAGEDMLDKLTTIVYVDWDNTLLGTQIVPKNTDVRGLVSDYVAEHFIYPEPALNNPLSLLNPADPTDETPVLDAVKSLERADTYRGKYPYDGPQPDGTTANTVTDGEQYPLTNKLDYVFFKRPMTHPDKPDPEDGKYAVNTADPTLVGKDHPDYIADLAAWEASDEWVQKTTEETGVDGDGNPTSVVSASYDIERPFAYGWAKCTVNNYEDVWTTLGVGELGQAAMGYSGASNGGYKEQNGAPASVTYAGTKEENRLVFADLEKGFSQDEGTVVLKAIYEPGKNLLGSIIKYRMAEKPYYNKANGNAASNGGGYTVDLTYERANSDSGVVQGVARIRDIIVRQDSTTDLYWETKNLNSGLNNADKNDAEVNKTKTAYVPVNTDNGDLAQFTLTLSARFHRIDYYVIDRYGKNFVNGQSRSNGNGVFYPSTPETDGSYDYSSYVLENYNYNNPDSNVGDVYYDVLDYADKEGSFGFVLYGTLNSMMQYATTFVQSGRIDSSFYDYTPADTMGDANLRKDVDGNRITVSDEYTNQMKLADAAAAAMAHVGQPDEADYWNKDKKCVELSYHQLQLYITTGTLLSRAAADAVPIKWCNLHADCANSRTGKPTDWPGVIGAAREANGGDPTKLNAFTNADELDAIVHLRKDASGGKYTSLTDGVGGGLADAIKAAVAALDAATGSSTTIYTWDQIQTQILGDPDSDNCKYARENYWWFDGQDVSFDDFAALKAAGLIALGEDPNAKTPSETAATARPAKLNQLKDIYDANKTSVSATGDVTEDWRKATENLCDTIGGKEGQTFTTFEDFTARFTGALKAYIDDTTYQTNDPDWYQVQYAILNGNSTAGAYGGPGASPDYPGYWWHNGAVKVQDLASLLKAARDAVAGNDASWNSFTDVADLYLAANAGTDAEPGLHFAADFAGTRYDSTTFATFKAKVMAFVQLPIVANNPISATSDDWDSLQYYIIEGQYPGTVVQRRWRSIYFWWKNGGTTATVDFATLQGKPKPEDRADDLAKAAADAAFRDSYNGNTIAWYGVGDEAALVTALESGRLVKSTDGTESKFPDDFTMYTAADVSDIKAAARAVLEAKSGSTSPTFPAPTFTWEELQYYILTGSTAVDNDVTATYWWKSEDEKPQDKNKPEDDFKTLVGYIAAVAEAVRDGDNATAATAEAALRTWFTADVAQNMGLYDSSGANLVEQGELDAIVWTGDILNDGALAYDFSDDLGDGGLCWGEDTDGDGRGDGDFTFTWYQMQDILLNGGVYLDNADNAILMVTDPSFGGFNCAVPQWVIDGKGTVTVPAGTFFMMRAPMMMSMAPKTEVTTALSEDGLTETTTTTLKVWNQETGTYDKQVTRVKVVREPGEEGTVVTTTTTVYLLTFDPETLEPMLEVQSEEQTVAWEPIETTEPNESLEPTETEGPGESPEPTETAQPSESPEPTETAQPSESPEPTETTGPSESPEPTETTEPSESPEPSETAEPEESPTPLPAESPGPEDDPADQPAEDQDGSNSGEEIPPDETVGDGVLAVPEDQPAEEARGPAKTPDPTEETTTPTGIGTEEDGMDHQLNITYAYRRALERRILEMKSPPSLRGPDRSFLSALRTPTITRSPARPLISSVNRRIPV